VVFSGISEKLILISLPLHFLVPGDVVSMAGEAAGDGGFILFEKSLPPAH